LHNSPQNTSSVPRFLAVISNQRNKE
jgi:hypothetical protein